MNQSSSPVSPAGSSPSSNWLQVWGPTIWAAAVLLAAIYFFQLSTQLGYSPRPGRLGPAFWPQAILIMLMVTSAIDLLAEARKALARRARGDVGEASAQNQVQRVWWLMALGLALTLAYVNFSTLIGFPLANFVFMLVFMFLAGHRKPVSATLTAGIGTVVLILLFVRVVYVSLPLGVGPFQDLTLLFYSMLGIG